MRGVLLVMLDRIDEGMAIASSSAQRLCDLGFRSAGDIWLAEVALIVGDHELAETCLRNACDALEASGSMAVLSTYAPRLGRLLCALGRYDEAEPLARKGRDLGAHEDNLTQQEWRQTVALVLSARGEHAEAERLAREAVQLGFRSDAPLSRGDALSILAEVLEHAGRREEAVETLRQALAEYELKPIIPRARVTRARIAALQQAPASAAAERSPPPTTRLEP